MPVTEEEILELAAEYRRIIVEALTNGDWREAARWAKGWIGSGGGARSVEPWLADVASSLLRGEGRTAVHSCDLALKHWLERPDQRAVMYYVRGEVVRRKLRDPKTAQADFDAATPAAPDWLKVAEAQVACREEALVSRKRKPSVEPAPACAGNDIDVPATPTELTSLAAPPPVWAVVHQILSA